MPCGPGKAVFVEKPLALTSEEVDRIVEVVAETGNDRLMVGFNRRFAPLLTEMKSQFGPACSSALTRYLVSAGPLAADSWYGNEALEGSRFTGEGGHFIDTLSWWVDSLPEEVYAVSGPEKDDVQVSRAVRERFQRCHHATPPAATSASRRRRSTLPPTAAAHGSTTSGRLLSGPAAASAPRESRGGQDKGQRTELTQFVEASLAGAAMPIPLETLRRRHQGDHRRCARACRVRASRTGVAAGTRSRISRPGWHACRVAVTSLAEVVRRVRDQVARSRRRLKAAPSAARTLR